VVWVIIRELVNIGMDRDKGYWFVIIIDGELILIGFVVGTFIVANWDVI